MLWLLQRVKCSALKSNVGRINNPFDSGGASAIFSAVKVAYQRESCEVIMGIPQRLDPDKNVRDDDVLWEYVDVHGKPFVSNLFTIS